MYRIKLTGRNRILLLERSMTVALRNDAMSFTGICSISKIKICHLPDIKTFFCKILPDKLKSKTFSSRRSLTLIFTFSLGISNDTLLFQKNRKLKLQFSHEKSNLMYEMNVGNRYVST